MKAQQFAGTETPRVFVIHENDTWAEPLRRQLTIVGVPFSEWFLDEGMLDLAMTPPEGIFYNRMSASSHTRGHRYAPEFAASVSAWLKRHGRRVVNGERALQLELSKVAQYEALKAFGITTPDTIAVIGRDNIADAAERIGFPVIIKHNRAGKGLGVRLLFSPAALAEHVRSSDFEESRDGITLVQQYVNAPTPFITRVEFVDGQLVYAVRVDTSEGFELCPADVCQIEASSSACPTVVPGDKFQILPTFEHPLLSAWQAFLGANDIDVAGVEFISDAAGQAFTYDINTNTNYNPEAEAKDGRSGMRVIASYLTGLLTERYQSTSQPASAA